MSHSQPKIWRKIKKIGGDISPASLAFWMYGSHLTYLSIVCLFLLQHHHSPENQFYVFLATAPTGVLTAGTAELH